MGVVRLLLALAVVISHMHPPHFAQTAPGYVAVQGFYIISGFYMALVLNTKYNFTGSTWVFYKQRYLRLVPMYWLAMICVLAIGAFYSLRAGRMVGKLEAWSQFSGDFSLLSLFALCASQITMFGLDAMMFVGLSGDPIEMHLTTNWAAEQLPAVKFMLVPPAWSLSVELLFYCIAPFIVRRSVLFQFGIVAFSFALRIAAGLWLNLVDDPWHNRFFPFEAGLFVLGSLVYRCLPQAEGLARLKKPWRNAIAISVGALICISVFFYKSVPVHEEIRRWGFLTIIFVAVPILFAATKRNVIDRKIGELSYPLYLLHPITFFAAEPILRRLHGFPQEIAILLIPVLVAIGAYALVEAPIERWRGKIFERQLNKRLESALPKEPTLSGTNV